MRKIILFVVLIIFSFPVFSRVSSRVKVIVKDIDTGLPIKGVHVFFSGIEKDNPFPTFCEMNPEYDYSDNADKTDKNGEFVFENVWSNDECYIRCVKEGYISINPNYLKCEKNPKYEIKTFEIKEGEIKVVVLKMKRGGCGFRVLLKKKDENGISPITEYVLDVDKYSKSIDPDTGKRYLYTVLSRPLPKYFYPQGYIDLKGFEAGEEFVIRVEKEGLPTRTKNFVVRDGDEINEVIFLYDYKTGIKVITKFSIKRIDFLSLDLARIKFISTIHCSNNKTEYFFLGLTPGEYKLYTFFSYENEKMRTKIYPLFVKKDRIISLNLNF